jgi:hypothetical protein
MDLVTIAGVTKGFWVAYVVVVVLWALDLLYLAGLTLVAILFGSSQGPVRIGGRDARFAASGYMPVLPVIAAAILAVVLMAMAIRARARAMAWVFGICGILVPLWAFVA